jgi:hypothetical protein
MENYKFRTIDGDDHVVLFTDEQLIKVGKLREQLRVSLYNPLRTKDKLNYGSLVLPYGFSGQFTSIRWQRSGQPPQTTNLTSSGTNAQKQPIYRGVFQSATNVTLVDLSNGNVRDGSKVSVGVEEWGWGRGKCRL